MTAHLIAGKQAIAAQMLQTTCSNPCCNLHDDSMLVVCSHRGPELHKMQQRKTDNCARRCCRWQVAKPNASSQQSRSLQNRNMMCAQLGDTPDARVQYENQVGIQESPE
mmetsp:Transcript_56165/g.149921  ORF Transcript_56165/g.149921 Transcript_56165/m.149921 type:complete len:109 (+) Transcript_56165:387-713(+)